MSRLWIVVTNQSKARIFTVADPHGDLLDIGELENPAGHAREQDLVSDRPGRSFDSMGQGRHAMGKSVEPVGQEAIRFAGKIGEFLEAACNEGRCNRLLLVAGPEFLGVLRKHLHVPRDVNIEELEKNLCRYEPRELRKHLPARLV